MIELRDVHKSFGAKQVLRGVDLSIPKGESMVIIGGSGTGKSVLLKCVLGLIAPDSGEILVDEDQRRMLRAAVSGLEYSIERDTLELAFRLGSGCYATSLLRELLDATDVTRSVSIDD